MAFSTLRNLLAFTFEGGGGVGRRGGMNLSLTRNILETVLEHVRDIKPFSLTGVPSVDSKVS